MEPAGGPDESYSVTVNSLLECCLRNERLSEAVAIFEGYIDSKKIYD